MRMTAQHNSTKGSYLPTVCFTLRYTLFCTLYRTVSYTLCCTLCYTPYFVSYLVSYPVPYLCVVPCVVPCVVSCTVRCVVPCGVLCVVPCVVPCVAPPLCGTCNFCPALCCTQFAQMEVLLKSHTTPRWFYGFRTLYAAECIYYVPDPAEPCNPCLRLRGDPALLEVMRTALTPHPRTPLVILEHAAL